MNQSENIAELAAALAKAQGAMTNPPKNREVKVKSEKGEYKFSYATLDAVMDVIRKPLADNGLSFAQSLYTNSDGKLRLVTLLSHSSGQWLKAETPVLFGGSKMQELGSAQTYARRYAITSLLGIAADEDDDANGADGNTIEEKKDRTPPPKPTPKADQVREQSKTGVDAWISQSRATIQQMPDAIVLTRWCKENAKLLDKMKAEHAEKYNDFMAWIDNQYLSLPSGKAA